MRLANLVLDLKHMFYTEGHATKKPSLFFFV